jgi:hypothetical protein
MITINSKVLPIEVRDKIIGVNVVYSLLDKNERYIKREMRIDG